MCNQESSARPVPRISGAKRVRLGYSYKREAQPQRHGGLLSREMSEGMHQTRRATKQGPRWFRETQSFACNLASERISALDARRRSIGRMQNEEARALAEASSSARNGRLGDGVETPDAGMNTRVAPWVPVIPISATRKLTPWSRPAMIQTQPFRI